MVKILVNRNFLKNKIKLLETIYIIGYNREDIGII